MQIRASACSQLPPCPVLAAALPPVPTGRPRREVALEAPHTRARVVASHVFLLLDVLLRVPRHRPAPLPHGRGPAPEVSVVIRRHSHDAARLAASGGMMGDASGQS